VKLDMVLFFCQLIGWFNAGTDDKVTAPDLFGCVELPEPAACFGIAESAYGVRQREQLLEIANDEKQQAMSWPVSLRSTFSVTSNSDNTKNIYGSPFLDAALGQVGALYMLRSELQQNMNAQRDDGKALIGTKKGPTLGSSSRARAAEQLAATQIDNMLPPELPTQWVQCDGCKKWRRVPWFVDSAALSDKWVCNDNTWDTETATCTAPEDVYDSTVENTLSSEGSAAVMESDIGLWRDVFCIKNLVYYEAQVKKIKP
jgi:hypothetical protein